jgi:hypothetical protein
MTAGLPGTGIGGVFYLLLAVLMPFRELVRLLRGKSSRQRWAVIAAQWGYVAAIGLTMWLEMWGLETLAKWGQRKGWLAENAGGTQGVWGNGAAWAAVASLLSLTAVFLTIHILRLALRWRRRLAGSASTEHDDEASQEAAIAEADQSELEMVGASREDS